MELSNTEHLKLASVEKKNNLTDRPTGFPGDSIFILKIEVESGTKKTPEKSILSDNRIPKKETEYQFYSSSKLTSKMMSNHHFGNIQDSMQISRKIPSSQRIIFKRILIGVPKETNTLETLSSFHRTLDFGSGKLKREKQNR